MNYLNKNQHNFNIGSGLKERIVSQRRKYDYLLEGLTLVDKSDPREYFWLFLLLE